MTVIELDRDQVQRDTQGRSVPVDFSPHPASAHTRSDTHRSTGAGGDPLQPPTMDCALPKMAPSGADGSLAVLADALDDIERTRVATENRVRALTQVKNMAGGQEERRLQATVDALATIEHDVVLQLQRALRVHPLGPWVKAQKGVGEKQGARLLAAVGDPYIDWRTGQPRTVYQLFALCGYHVVPVDHVTRNTHQRSVDGDFSRSHPDHGEGDDQKDPVGVAATRRKGQKANWSATAKMRAHLVAESCMKTPGGHYRAVYDAGRAKYDDAVHHTLCTRCGPSGKPAPTGSPLSPGHQHARALRLVAKEILKDMWHESKRVHEEASTDPDTNCRAPSGDSGLPALTRGKDPLCRFPC